MVTLRAIAEGWRNVVKQGFPEQVSGPTPRDIARLRKAADNGKCLIFIDVS
jgi:hypothetical protein